MAKDGKIFHESWYRISDQKITLRSSVKIQRQIFRGERWYVLQDSFSNQFYRLRPSAYEFVVRLNGNNTVEQVWNEMMNRDPENSPDQGDIIELLAQLYHANLLHYDQASNSEKLFERYNKKKQRIFRATLKNIMFFRIPLFDPDRGLKAILPFIKLLYSNIGLILWLAVVGYGLKLVFDNFDGLQEQSQAILAPSNFFLLFVSMVIIKTIHEFGHSFAVRRFGGEVHTMGVMFLLFNPLPYMDASAAWAFKNRWERVLVGAAGMIFEVFIAAIAVVVWRNTAEGATINAIAYNMIFIASVSTVLFNINPLLRFDGYYILTDLLNMPNLHQQSAKHLTYLLEKYAFGCKDCETPANSSKEAWLLGSFGILSNIYRIVIFTGILLFIADKFLLFGIIMAIICAIAWIITPLIKFFKYITTSPKLEDNRKRVLSVSFTFFFAVFSFFYFLPFPDNFKSAGILKAEEFSVIVNKTEGKILKTIAVSGSRVKQGDTLAILKNEELALEIVGVEASLEAERVKLQKAIIENQADIKSISSRIDFFTKRISILEQDQKELTVRASGNGVWIAPEINNYLGMEIKKGTPLGQIINDSSFYFVSVIPQEDVNQVFKDTAFSAEIRLSGQADIVIPVKKYTSIPMDQSHLPSSALGWAAGGDLAVDVNDQYGTKSTEPFYEVRAGLQQAKAASFFHGRTGKIRFELPSRPLLQQWWLAFRQLIQKRYQI